MNTRLDVKLLVLLSGLTLLYSVVVLGYTATCADLRVRVFLSAPELSHNQTDVIARSGPGLISQGDPIPAGPFRLIQIHDQSIESFYDYIQQLNRLRNATLPPDGIINTGDDPSKTGYLPSLVQEYGNRKRWVKVSYENLETQQVQTSHVLIQSLPALDLLQAFVWFFCELGIFALGAVAYWNRPQDRTARLFFVTCVVTIGAYIGGFHWWIISGNLLLTIPFMFYGVFLPVVTAHFFLVFPQPQSFWNTNPRVTFFSLYLIPIIAVLFFLGTILTAHTIYHFGNSPESVQTILQVVSEGVSVYLFIAGGYFLLALWALYTNYRTIRTPIEHNQLKWLLRAATFSAIPLGYLFYLIFAADRTGFALGKAGLPMFLVSLSFMFAYAIGIIRHRMMLLDQIISKGVLYYIVSTSTTCLFATLLAFGGMMTSIVQINQTPLNFAAWLAVLILGVMMMLWLRDRLQQVIDRRFYREKYQLDRALQRMNLAVGKFVQQDVIVDMMLSSCQDVLSVDCAAFYLRGNPEGPYHLQHSLGFEEIPLQVSIEPTLIQLLQEKGYVQRTLAATRDDLSLAQDLVREVQAELIHALEIDGSPDGLIVMGSKRHKMTFTAEDLTFLNALCQITTVALHSVKVHQDFAQVNEELRLKSEKIAHQERQIRFLQAELDEERDESVSPGPKRNDTFRRDLIRGDSLSITQVLETARKAADSQATVLIRGESGTGKELLAKVLHDNSPRRNAPMISVHCAALTPSLLESELFGHIKGAFTGASETRIGRFQAAEGGTLFLDEIGDISLDIQIKLLRVLQERCVEPVGSSETIPVDVRLITATHQNLEQLVQQGDFREDLFYRLNVIMMTLPPLRERKEDLFELTRHFLGDAAKQAGKPVAQFDSSAYTILEQYHWPGNIRELQNVIERAVVLSDGPLITRKDLPSELLRSVQTGTVLKSTATIALQETDSSKTSKPLEMKKYSNKRHSNEEKNRLQAALDQCQGNKAEAARLLGMPRSTYYSRLKKYGII